MFNPVEKLYRFLKYWYFRYLLVTELFMVEKWEVVTIHALFITLFTTLAIINMNIVVPALAALVSNT